MQKTPPVRFSPFWRSLRVDLDRHARTKSAILFENAAVRARASRAHSRPPCVFWPVHARPKNRFDSILLLKQQNSCGGLTKLLALIRKRQTCFFYSLRSGRSVQTLCPLLFYALRRRLSCSACSKNAILTEKKAEKSEEIGKLHF